MTKKSNALNTLAIMSVFLIAASAGSVGATVQPMIEAFPDVPAATIRLLTTIPSMTGMVVTFLVGLVAGKKIPFRTICVLGSIFMLAGGVLPVFLTGSVYAVLACRLLLGVGTGCFGIRNALVIKTYPEEQRANMLGKGSFAQNLASIFMSSIAGILADISWNLGFAVYAIAAVTVAMTVLFLKEPEAPAAAVQTQTGKKDDARYSPVIFVMGAFLALASMSGYCIIIGISTFLKEQSLGSASMAGTVISAFSIGGVVFSYIFGKLFAVLKKYNLSAFALVVALGLAFVLWGGNVVFIYGGAFLCGGGFACYMAATLAFAGQMAEPSLVTSSTTIIMTINQIGIVLSSYFVTLAGKLFSSASEVSDSFLLGILCMVIVAVISQVCRIYPEGFKTKK